MVPFVFSILPCRKQQLVLSLASSIRPATAVAASIFLHSAFYVLSHPIPVRSLPSGEAEEEAATLQSRSAVPSSPLLSSPLPSVRSFQTLLRISLPPASPRSLLGGEGRGGEKAEEGRRSGEEMSTM